MPQIYDVVILLYKDILLTLPYKYMVICIRS